jgi:hypothetical protein
MNLESLIEIDIYEAVPELTQTGITFWLRAWKMKLGLETSLMEHLLTTIAFFFFFKLPSLALAGIV